MRCVAFSLEIRNTQKRLKDEYKIEMLRNKIRSITKFDQFKWSGICFFFKDLREKRI
jgi:hypothetical protein